MNKAELREKLENFPIRTIKRGAYYFLDSHTIDQLLSLLHSYGLMRRVNKELPLPTHKMIERLVSPVPLMSPYYGSAIEMYRLAQQDMGEAGYEAVESLVKENK